MLRAKGVVSGPVDELLFSHSVIVFSGTKAGHEYAPLLLRPGGTMVCVGLPKDTSVVAGVHPIMLCTNKLNAVGCVAVTLKECDGTLGFTARGPVRPILTHKWTGGYQWDLRGDECG
jgi:propanol-preferring alcohol dehydrogenase